MLYLKLYITSEAWCKQPLTFMGVCPGMKGRAKAALPSGTVMVMAMKRMLALPYLRIRMIRMLYVMLWAAHALGVHVTTHEDRAF
jgi:hypothetical protein